MPRPPSDLRRRQVMLSPTTEAQLDAIAAHHGWTTDGAPSRSRAIRELVAAEAARIAAKKNRKNPA